MFDRNRSSRPAGIETLHPILHSELMFTLPFLLKGSIPTIGLNSVAPLIYFKMG